VTKAPSALDEIAMERITLSEDGRSLIIEDQVLPLIRRVSRPEGGGEITGRGVKLTF
jgi:hypothetical protein